MGRHLLPPKKEKERSTLEIACLMCERALSIKPPKITHKVEFLFLGLAFHT